MITGGGGMLAHDMTTALTEAGEYVTVLRRADLDITNAAATAKALQDADAVINCAAYTAVDDAQTHEATAFSVNATGVAYLAEAARGKPFVHISTDYVFDGAATSPYLEDAELAPLGAYGRTKAAGEWAARAHHDAPLILRTAWLYGEFGKCFPATMLRVARMGKPLKVITDQVGQPTWTRDVADLVVRLHSKGVMSGTFHATSSGQASWRDFAQAVVASDGFDPSIIGATTAADYPLPAPRPSYSVLSHDGLRAAGVEPIGDWRERWECAAPSLLKSEFAGEKQ